MAVLNIGLVGAGFVAHHHLTAYAALADRARVVAIADPDAAARDRQASRFGIPATYAAMTDMIAAGGLDAVDILAPREFHADLCREAARAGLPILCQKPLAPTHAEALALVADLPTETRLMVHENWRFRPHYRTIAGWIADGRVGPLRTVAMHVLSAGCVADADGAYPALTRQPMMAGLDRMLLMEVMIHHVDVLRFLAGNMRLLTAVLGQDCAALRGEDRASLMMLSDTGAAVSLVGDFMNRGAGPTPSDRLEIVGRDGTIRLDGDRLDLFPADGPAETVTIDLPADYAASYRGAIAHFLDCLSDGTGFETAPDDNLRTLHLVEAAYGAGRSPGPSAG